MEKTGIFEMFSFPETLKRCKG